MRSSDLGFEGAGSSPERDRPGEGLSWGGSHGSPCGGLSGGGGDSTGTYTGAGVAHLFFKPFLERSQLIGDT